MFIATSALEHFNDYLDYFMNLRDFIKSSNRNIIQIHLFPSEAGFLTSPHHGFREFTLRMISKITKIFTNFSYSILFNLGGIYTTSVYYNYTTKPLKELSTDWRLTKTNQYWTLLTKALNKDMQKRIKYPFWYALVIHSNFRKKLF